MTPEQSALRKVTRRLLPFLFLLYIVCFLDRVNIGFAALQMNHDLGFSPAVYGFGAGIFFLGYVLFEVPSNLMLARVGARRWIARIMITWGIIASAMMFVRGPLSLFALRFLLGAAEAGFFPGMIYYLSGWFPAAERARAIARFMVAIPLSGVVGGPLSGALLDLNGRWGLAGWQWLFLLEGLPAVALGVVVLRRLSDRPEDAAWLTPAERAAISIRLRQEHEQCEQGLSVRQALANGTIWRLALLFMVGNAFGVYVLGLWLPQIVRDVSGLGNLGVGMLSAVPNLVAAVAMVLVGSHSDRSGERPLHLAVAATAAAVGLGVSASLGSTAVVIFGLSVAAAGLLSMHGPFWPLPSTFLSGSAAAAGIALITSVANLGGFLGPYAMGLLKGHTGSFRSGLLLLALMSVVGGILAVRLRHDPRLR
ncbi:MAG TPA: MFS transporter [Gemmatimonadales bacterium]|jgi:ACS family tartrate transporter-like MFS transporter